MYIHFLTPYSSCHIPKYRANSYSIPFNEHEISRLDYARNDDYIST